VPEDPKWELAVAETVFSFYQKLLRDSLGEPVPLPTNLHHISLAELDQHFPNPLARILAWLKLLDLAVTPSMLRMSLSAEVDPEVAETLLRYYARKKAGTDLDRDKADFVATFLYRNPRVPGQWEKHGYTLDGIVPIPPFEIALIEILADSEPLAALPEDYLPILREFGDLHQELQDFSTLDSLTERGTVQRGRDLKQALGTWFYHPAVLATIGPYNSAVGKKLEELFRATTQHLKSFAESVHQEGGDLTSPVEGKVTVQHLAQIEEGEILKAEYSAAQEKFRRVSRVKRAVDLRRAGKTTNPRFPDRPAPATEHKFPARMPAPENIPTAKPRVQPPPPALPSRFAGPPSAPASGGLAGRLSAQAVAAQPAKTYDAQLEEGRLRSVEDSIRAFVRAADAKVRQIVPMRHFNLTLTPTEADAFAAEYWDEKSFRGEYARALAKIVALAARMNTELEEVKQRQNSAHLWKPHAKSIEFLLDVSTVAFDQANSVLALAGQRGLNDKINAMNVSLQKLRTRIDYAGPLLHELSQKGLQGVQGGVAPES
jgi:hypothetical protein